jgi:hypothetical protein
LGCCPWWDGLRDRGVSFHSGCQEGGAEVLGRDLPCWSSDSYFLR